MSESAKPKTSASDALSPDEAERVAAKFRPSWERVAAPRAAKQTLLGVAPVTPEPEPAASPNPAPAPPEATVIVAPQAAPASTREVTEVLRMPTTSRSSTPPEFLQGRSNLRYWVAAALAVIAAGAFVALRSRNAGETPTSETSSTASSEASSAPATATGSAGNAPDESPEEATELAAAGPAEAEPTDTEPVANEDAVNDEAPTTPSLPPVHLHAQATPPEAPLYLDGEEVPNPFDADLAFGSTHRLEARLAGYRDDHVTVELSKPRRVMLTLKRLPVPKPATTKRAARRATTKSAKSTKRSSGSTNPFVSDNPY